MSTDQPPRAGADFTTPETFQVTDWKRLAGGTFLVLGFIGLLLAALVWFMAGALAGMLGRPMPMRWGVLAAVLVVGALFGLTALQVERQAAHLSIVMTLAGVAQRQVEATRFIAWPDLVGAGRVEPLGRMGEVHGETDASKALGQAVGTAAMEAGRAMGAVIGLAGFGRVGFDPSASQGRRALSADGAFGRAPDGGPSWASRPPSSPTRGSRDAWATGCGTTVPTSSRRSRSRPASCAASATPVGRRERTGRPSDPGPTRRRTRRADPPARPTPAETFRRPRCGRRRRPHPSNGLCLPGPNSSGSSRRGFTSKIGRSHSARSAPRS